MAPVKKILLLQLYSNGDCLYATTIARQIKTDYPGCRLTWVIADFCKAIIDGNPYVDEVMPIKDVQKNNVAAFRKLRRKFLHEKRAGVWDEVFITHNMDSNLAYYDGTIRGMILRAYQKPITVPLQPVLELHDDEKNRVAAFAEANKLRSFKHVILWEFAPQSGQAALHFDLVMKLARRITEFPGTCVILSSAKSFVSSGRIIDASILSIRENAALTHYCSLLIGCSSGITWLSTSSAAKQLPMVQLLDPNTAFINAPSVDFKRYGSDDSALIEITTITEENVYGCVKTILENNFAEAKGRYHTILPLQFNTTRTIVYNMLCYLQFGAIGRHWKIMTGIYGYHSLFIKQFLLGIVTFPFKLIRNIIRKNIGTK